MSNELPPIRDEDITGFPFEEEFAEKEGDDVFVVNSVDEQGNKKEKPEFKKNFILFLKK